MSFRSPAAAVVASIAAHMAAAARTVVRLRLWFARVVGAVTGALADASAAPGGERGIRIPHSADSCSIFAQRAGLIPPFFISIFWERLNGSAHNRIELGATGLTFRCIDFLPSRFDVSAALSLAVASLRATSIGRMHARMQEDPRLAPRVSL